MEQLNTRNFSAFEILHRFEGLNSKIYSDYPVECIGLVQMGCMQVVVDLLSWFFKEDISCVINSGYRPPEINATVSKGQAKSTSNHMYRVDMITDGPHKFKKMVRCASDFIPCYSSNLNKVVNMDEAFCFLAPILKGELYINKTVYGKDKQGIIHYAQQGGIIKVPFVTIWDNKDKGTTKDVPWKVYYNCKDKNY
jgi:hypothetical protein